MPVGPFKPGDLRTINDLLRLCSDVEDVIRRGEAAGYDCQAHCDICDHLRRRLTALKEQFFTGEQ